MKHSQKSKLYNELEFSNQLFEKCHSYSRATTLKQGGIYPYYKEIQQVNGPLVVIEGKSKIMAGANNYLGIADSDVLKEAAKNAVDNYGIGSTGSRLIAGNFDLYTRLENIIASFFEKEDALIFTTGYQANVGTISALVHRHEYVVLDSEAHASLVDGAYMSFGEVKRFRHNNAVDLSRVLDSIRGKNILVVTDGVYSMEGDLVNLPDILSVCKDYGAKILIDEAHSFGVLGSGGRGVAEHYGLLREIDLITATFSKSCGSLGGFVVGKKEIIDYIRHNARSILFSTGMPALILAAVEVAFLNYIVKPDKRAVLLKNVDCLKSKLKELGFNTGKSQSPIIPLIIGDQVKTNTFWKELYEAGIFVGAMIPPAVPPHKSLLRMSCSANFKNSDIDYMLLHCKKIGKKLGIIF